MLFAEVSDAVWLAVIGLVAMVVKELLDQRRADKVAVKVAEVKVSHDEAAVKSDAVAARADEKMDALTKVAGDTHTLVNSNMGAQLELNAVMSRRLADITRDPEDEKTAVLAAKMWVDHKSRQATVDAKDARPAGGPPVPRPPWAGE